MSETTAYTFPKDTIIIKFGISGDSYVYNPDVEWENINGNPQNNGQLMDLLVEFYSGGEIEWSADNYLLKKEAEEQYQPLTLFRTINGSAITGDTEDIVISGGGDASIVNLSTEEYNALPDEEKEDPTKIYVINDAESVYYKKAEVDAEVAKKQNILSAGTNIDITDDVISVTGITVPAFRTINGNAITGDTSDIKIEGGNYSAGTNIDITNDVISVTGITVPTKTSELTNDSGFLTGETDPTVPSWAKQSTKPTYTAEEVGALPDTTVIPTKTSDLTNDSEFTSKTYVDTEVAKKQNVLSAGTNIEITDDDVINCTADLSIFKLVETLPTEDIDPNKIYLVPAETTGVSNIYDEYSYINNAWEKIGFYTSEVDLTPYLKKDDAATLYQPIGNYLTAETDPTVPEWAKAESKPTYTASEVGALPDSTIIPTIPDFRTINGSAITGDTSDIVISGGSGGTSIINLTVDEYNALTDDERADTTKMYVISDADDTYYTKEEVDTALTNYYTKTELTFTYDEDTQTLNITYNPS